MRSLRVQSFQARIFRCASELKKFRAQARSARLRLSEATVPPSSSFGGEQFTGTACLCSTRCAVLLIIVMLCELTPDVCCWLYYRECV